MDLRSVGYGGAMRRWLGALDHFDVAAPFYDRVIRGQAIDRLRELAGLTTEDWLLDVGGGTGRIAEGLRPYVKGVCVLDRSPGMLREAAIKGELVPCRAGAEALPFAASTFAKIVVVDAFHHIQEQPAAARELLRVLSPGGSLVVEEPDIRRPSVKLVALGEAIALMRSRFLEPSALVQLFAASDVCIRVVEQAPNFWVVVEKSGLGR